MMKWPPTTNIGTVMMKLRHQQDEHRLFKDDYLEWFIEEQYINEAKSAIVPAEPSEDRELEFFRIAYHYTNLRERFFDDVVTKAVSCGGRQLLLLGSGYDTRFLRMSILDESINIVEVDRHETINQKKSIINARLGSLPKNVSMISTDFELDDLVTSVLDELDGERKTVIIWQGVTYYLTKESVTRVLKMIGEKFGEGTTFGFDCCTPSMIGRKRNDGINSVNRIQLGKIGEPYLFGIYPEDIVKLLKELGFTEIEIKKQDELEREYQNRRSLPDDMWYVVVAEKAEIPA